MTNWIPLGSGTRLCGRVTRPLLDFSEKGLGTRLDSTENYTVTLPAFWAVGSKIHFLNYLFIDFFNGGPTKSLGGAKTVFKVKSSR